MTNEEINDRLHASDMVTGHLFVRSLGAQRCEEYLDWFFANEENPNLDYLYLIDHEVSVFNTQGL